MFNNVNNYRGITILSYLGKLFFMVVINCRLTNYVESLGIIDPEQAGFRNCYSVMDHVFTSNMLLQYKARTGIHFLRISGGIFAKKQVNFTENLH